MQYRTLCTALSCAVIALPLPAHAQALAPAVQQEQAVGKLEKFSARTFDCMPVGPDGAIMPKAICKAESFELPQLVAAGKSPRVKVKDKAGTTFEVRRSSTVIKMPTTPCDRSWIEMASGRDGGVGTRAMQGEGGC